ncbi:alpha/beta hydrolase [Paraburkholderia sp. Cy-641]|uniref:alpha/beta fold hydrolase n=1 Tax=Paraburkholderia sp. Cy-641 TaxID=2608337 RepID=UPI0014233C9B
MVLFVHGATFSGLSAFDTPLIGGSWLEFAAMQGCDAYAIDIRGYGLSSRPERGKGCPWHEKPYARTDEAILDLSAAVDYILAQTGVRRVNLVGWSWGTAICGGYAAVNKSKVDRLVMFAPIWTIKYPHPLATWWMPALGPLYASTLTSFREVTFETARQRWFRGLDSATAASMCSEAELKAWWSHTTATEPNPESKLLPVLRAPNGVLADIAESWGTGNPTYNPEEIEAPTLLILGEWDVDTPLYMAQELFSRLISVPYKRLEVLQRGTHAMSLECNRFHLYRRIQQFLTQND